MVDAVLVSVDPLSLIPSPTGSDSVDFLWCALWTAAWVALGRAGSNLVLCGVSAVVFVLDLPQAMSLSAAAIALCAYVFEWRKCESCVLRGVLGGLIGIHMLALPSIGGFGGSAIAGAALTAAMAISALTRSSRLRLICMIGLGVAGTLLIWSLVGAGVGTARSVAPLRHATTALVSGSDALAAGDIIAASRWFDIAAEDLARAKAASSSLSTAPARVVPILSQHHAVSRELIAGLAEVTESTRRIVSEIAAMGDFGAREFDVQSIDALSTALERLAVDTAELGRSMNSLDSPWLIGPIRGALEAVQGDLDEVIDEIGRAADLAALMPEMFGSAQPRRYFVAFVTPAEARPGLGFLGNFAELTIADGEVSLSRFGRTSDLNIASRVDASRVLPPGEYATRYASFGSGGGTLPAGPNWWSVVTLSPDMVGVSSVISALYEQAGLGRVDGVVTIDPDGLADLMLASGPVEIPSLGRTFDETNVADFLVREQYVAFGADHAGRVEFLDELTRRTMEQLVGSPATNAVHLAVALRSAATSGHAVIWSRHPVEQRMFARMGFTGSFVRPAVGDGLAITQLNSGANKLDAFIRRDITYTADVDPASGRVRAVATVTLRNELPTGDLPGYVIGNARGDPPGTNRCFVTLYSPLGLDDLAVDGAAADVTVGSELGWQYAEREVVVPPGGSVELRYTLSGQIAIGDDGYEIFMPYRGVALADSMRIDVTTRSGDQLVDFDGFVSSSRTFGPGAD